MNERMLELAKEAGLKFKSEVALSPPEIKFAELIMQECIKAAETDWHTPDGWGWTLGQAKAIEFIYERFGVEE